MSIDAAIIDRDYDLIVVGGGPVGACLAIAAREMRVALVSHERRVPVAQREGIFDARVYALTPGNVELLRRLGVWRHIPAARVEPVRAMHVFGDDGRSSLEFDAYRAGVPELAWIVEDAALQDALWQVLDAEIFAPAECEKLDDAVLMLRGGTRLVGSLVVGADGANSFVRRAAAIAATEKGYEQAAVVANFACEQAHRGVARQWFQGGAVLALLPLPGRQVSMVWSLPASRAANVVALAPEALCEQVEAASRGVLGKLSLTTPPRTYALRKLRAQRLVQARVALLGDAAHVIHPLAGQGLNLGLQDAQALARVLAEREPGRDPGDLRLLRRYERMRAEPILAMNAVVDGLFRLFGSEDERWSRFRNAGLNLTDRFPVLKNLLIRQAMN
ncbi:MAG TPA: FAD-dependent monooxygenase [Burkholderiales bacterium]|nr:FAD-dependent monooxygenase [Burkholderiales bacterium]